MYVCLLANLSLGFPGGSLVKNLPAVQETSSVPGSVLSWEIPWTQESSGQQSVRSQKSQTQLRN